MTDYVLTMLAKRRLVLVARVSKAQAELNRRRAAVRALDASVERFEQSQTAKRTRSERRYQTGRMLLSMLRTTPEPMPLRAITLRIMELRHQDATDARLIRAMIERTRMSLLRQQRKGLVRGTEGPGQAVLWTINP